MTFPDDLKYTKDHEWIKIEGNIATIGVTDHAQGELGDVVYVDIPEDDAELNIGDSFGTIEAVKTVADLFAPLSGKIVEVNEDLNDNPEVVNTDPYGGGWMIKMELSELSQVDDLLDVGTYKQSIGQ